MTLRGPCAPVKRVSEAPYIAGGLDPDPAAGRAEERRLGLWLVVMIVVIVSSGFVIGTLVALLGPLRGP